jgi:AraC-like DNA-binding protein
VTKYAGSGRPSRPLPSVSFTTQGLPVAQRFEAYRADAIRFAELIQREAWADSSASYTAWSLGSIVMKRTSSPPLDQRRTPAMVRRDGLDHWLLNIPVRSAQRVVIDGTTQHVSAARPILMSCDQPFAVERPGAEEDWLVAFVTRDALPGLGLPGGVDGVQALTTPMGQLLVAFLRDMAACLPNMTLADVPHLTDATLTLLRGTLAPGADNLKAARPHAEAVLRKRVCAIIRARLGSAILTPERLCRDAGLSRSALYRLFEPLGGVAKAIKAERLAEARRRLEDSGERRSIQQIADSVGYCDASVFSRAFRRRYGATASEVREAATFGIPLAMTAPRTTAGGFLDMVSRLEV